MPSFKTKNKPTLFHKRLKPRKIPGLRLTWVADNPTGNNPVEGKLHALEQLNNTRQVGKHGYEQSCDNTGYIAVNAPGELKDIGGSFTVVVLGKWAGNGSWDGFGGLICRRSNDGTEANGFSIQRPFSSGNGLGLFFDNSTAVNLALGIDDIDSGNYETVVLRLDTIANAIDTWVSGVPHDVALSAGGNSPTTGLGDLRLNAGRDAVFGDGDYVMCAVFDRAIPDKLCKAISINPLKEIFRTETSTVTQATVAAAGARHRPRRSNLPTLLHY